MGSVIVLQHVACETLGAIADALELAGVTVEYVRPYLGQSVPQEMGGAAGLIVMGGPMSVYEQEQYPFLRDEIRLIEDALRREQPILGVCLGSQLLAAALGAEVASSGSKEIGWYPITLTSDGMADRLLKGVPPSLTAFHWHSDIFSLPRGAVSLAASEMTNHQAFRYGRAAYGFLFHMEATGTIIADMVETLADELQDARVEGSQLRAQARHHLPRLSEIGGGVFERWVEMLRT